MLSISCLLSPNTQTPKRERTHARTHTQHIQQRCVQCKGSVCVCVVSIQFNGDTLSASPIPFVYRILRLPEIRRRHTHENEKCALILCGRLFGELWIVKEMSMISYCAVLDASQMEGWCLVCVRCVLFLGYWVVELVRSYCCYICIDWHCSFSIHNPFAFFPDSY